MQPNTLNQAPVPPAVPPAATPSTGPTAQLQAIVDFMPNITIVGSKTVLLEWTADNRIRIYEMNFDTHQATSIMLDVDVKQVTKVTGTLNQFTFHVGEKSYRLLFARMQTAGVGAAGAAYAFNELKASGAKLWLDKLKQNGIPIKIMGWAATWAIAIGMVVVIAAIVIIVKIANGTF